MLDFYGGPTPNGRKIAIMVEELGLEYRTHVIDILGGDQFTPEYLAINPNNKFPAIVDPDGPDGQPITVWESGAILIYLAEKHGRLIPGDPRARIEMLKWLMFQMGGLGPMAGQFAFFRFYAPEKIPLAINRYAKELNRQMRVMNGRLEQAEYFAGDEYSIADIAIYPWWASMKLVSDEPRPALDRWDETIAARPAVAKGSVLFDKHLRPEVIEGGMKVKMNETVYSTLYGSSQHEQGGATA
jgi:GSH-dependent disulfide-bond oxidoreductase